jgi:type IV pilus assembly protein PilZ
MVDRSDRDDADDGLDRRARGRFPVVWSVDCETEDTFLYAEITNISEMGIFVRTLEPLAIGTELKLRFSPAHVHMPEFVLDGTVQWINPPRPGCPNPGMGVRFHQLSLEDRERIVEVIRTISYLPRRYLPADAAS